VRKKTPTKACKGRGAFEQKEREERKIFGVTAEGGDIKFSLFPSFPSVQIPVLTGLHLIGRKNETAADGFDCGG